MNHDTVKICLDFLKKIFLLPPPAPVPLTAEFWPGLAAQNAYVRSEERLYYYVFDPYLKDFVSLHYILKPNVSCWAVEE